jgi:predicted Zn finger-like uncharacterized protein
MNSTRSVGIISDARPGGLPTAVLQRDEQKIVGSPMCPMCHTSASVTQSAIEAGGEWRCVRCGQHWDAGRLAAVAGYAQWADDRERVGLRGTESPHDATSRDASVEGAGSRP